MLININLLPTKKKKSRLLLFSLIGLSVLLLASALLFGAIHMKKAELAQTEQKLTEAQLLREALETAASENVSSEQSSAERLEAAVAWSQARKLPASPLLTHLVERLPERGFFQSVVYVSGETLTMTVQFDTSRQGAYYLSELKSSPWISSAEILSVNTSVMNTEENAEEMLQSHNALPRYLVDYQVVFNEEAVIQALNQEGGLNE